jgi:hypothetical protein
MRVCLLLTESRLFCACVCCSEASFFAASLAAILLVLDDELVRIY